MSNSYTRVTAEESIACSDELYAQLQRVLESDAEKRRSTDGCDDGFEWTRTKDGYLYAYAPDSGDPDAWSEELLDVLGAIITAAELTHWEFGVAYWDDKCRPDSAGGYKFRIMADGSLVFGVTEWPA